MRKAEQAILKSLQEEAFSEEIKILKSLGVQNDDASRKFAKRRDLSMKKTSSLYRSDPFLEENGVSRNGDQIRNAPVSYEIKHPVIFPSKSHVTILLVRYHYERIRHQGRGMTLNDLRSHGYWLIGGSFQMHDLPKTPWSTTAAKDGKFAHGQTGTSTALYSLRSRLLWSVAHQGRP